MKLVVVHFRFTHSFSKDDGLIVMLLEVVFSPIGAEIYEIRVWAAKQEIALYTTLVRSVNTSTALEHLDKALQESKWSPGGEDS